MKDKWYIITVGASLTFITANGLKGPKLTIQSMAIIGIIGVWQFHAPGFNPVVRYWKQFIQCVLLLESYALWHFTKRKERITTSQSIYRPNASPGLFSVLLVPMALLGDLNAGRQFQDATSLEMWLSLVLVAAIIMRLTLAENPYRQQLFWIALSSFGAVVYVLYGWICVVSVGILYLTWTCLEWVPYHLPKSFTFGELAVVLQIIASWINRMNISLFQEQMLSEQDIQLAWFVCTLVIAVTLATLVVCLLNAASSLWLFVTVYILAAAMSLIFLQAALQESPILWLLNFVSSQCTKVILLVTWIMLLAVAIVWTVIQALLFTNQTETSPLLQHSQTLVEQDQNATHGNMRVSRENVSTSSFTARKVFHVFIVLVYFPGLILDMRLLLLASIAAFSLFVILEAARALRVPVMGEHLDRILRTFIDDRDQGPVFLTHIYLLVGMSLPLWISHNLFSSSTASIELYSGFLSLGVGDTIACVAGKAWGRTQWPGSKKTIEGTLSSIMSQIVLVILGSYIGILSFTSFLNVFAGITLCALAEAFTDQIDNLILPLILYPFLCIS